MLWDEELERFVSTCLFEGQVWDSPRTSDGISRIERVVERHPERLGICGRIWSIEQTRHIFWLEVWRVDAGAAWVLYFDVIETTERRALRAVLSCERPQEIEWRVVLGGEASDSLVISPGSTRALIRD